MRRRLLVLQVAIVLLTVVAAGAALLAVQQREVRAGYRDQMLQLSHSVAQDPRIVSALGTADPAAQIQPIAEVVRNATGVAYVVVTDTDGIRMSHPDPERIGEKVSTDPSIPLAGQTYIGTQTGTLGRSWRVKVPVFDPAGQVIGTVSVGTLETTLSSQFFDELTVILLVLGGAAVLGVVGAAAATQLIRKRIYQLDPDDAAELLRAHRAMLHGIREGVVAVDSAYRVRLVNDEAARLLDLDPADVEIDAPMEEVLEPHLAQLVRSGVTDDRLVLAGSRVLVARCDAATHDHDAVGTVLMLRDRTDLHAVVRELDGAHSLTEGLRAQAHEHSNRLHVLLGLLELGETQEAMAFIRRTAAGGPLTGSQQAPGVQDVEVCALLHSLVHRGVERSVEIEVVASSTVPVLSGDPALQMDVLTVLANLVENALTACRLGGRVLVELGIDDSSAAGSRLTLRVDDDGPGMPAELAERVFEVGVTTKEAAGPGGPGAHGIGLALVRRIALRRGGSAQVAPSPLGGSGFVVQLDAQVTASVDAVLSR